MPDLDRLERRLSFRFSERSLLTQALTHKSHGRPNNERLEFLGDAALGYVIARALYERFPAHSEESLTLLRASLVRKDTLAQVAAEVDLGAYLRLGQGERKSGGRQRSSILADALEAVLGAIALDGGLAAAEAVIGELFAGRLADADPDHAKDPKTQLQERLQAAGLALPAYEVLETRGSEHAREFVVRCVAAALELEAQGSGSSRREAEKQAAAAMIALLDDSQR